MDCLFHAVANERFCTRNGNDFAAIGRDINLADMCSQPGTISIELETLEMHFRKLRRIGLFRDFDYRRVKARIRCSDHNLFYLISLCFSRAISAASLSPRPERQTTMA